jgi:CheY-like chemotaxis protein
MLFFQSLDPAGKYHCHMIKKILIIDSDRKTLETVRQQWASSDRYEPVTASNAKEAVDLLNAHHFSAVVSGVHLPDFDVVELIAYMTRSFPSTPCVVLLDPGQPPPQFGNRSAHDIVLAYLGKPVNLETLSEKLEHDNHPRQTVRTRGGMALKHFLPLIYISGKTCRMDIRYGPKEKASLFFFRGGLVDAVWGNAVGEAAVSEVITWDGVKISIAKLPHHKKDMPVRISLMDKIGVTWEKEAPPAGPIPAGEEILPALPEKEPPPAAETVAEIELGLKKYAGVLQSVKGYLGLAVLSPGGTLIAADSQKHLPDAAGFYSDIAAVFQHCNQTADRRGFQRCNGFTLHTPKSMIMMIPSTPPDSGSGDDIFYFVALMSPEANGYYMQMQLEKLIPRICG